MMDSNESGATFVTFRKGLSEGVTFKLREADMGSSWVKLVS